MRNNDETNGAKPVDREAVRMLAIELGAREAARRVGIKESTVLSWARRLHWKLPKRKGGAISAIKLQSRPGDVLIAVHEGLEGATKTALMQTLAKAAQQVAGKEALDISNTAQLRDVCLAAARIFGWDGKPQTEVNITNQVGVICDEATRMRLIALRERITLAERRPESERETQPQGDVGLTAGSPVSPTMLPPSGMPGATLWHAPVGTSAPQDASPAFRAWLEHEGPEPEEV
jgi:hypothetical protein